MALQAKGFQQGMQISEAGNEERGRAGAGSKVDSSLASGDAGGLELGREVSREGAWQDGEDHRTAAKSDDRCMVRRAGGAGTREGAQ